MYKPFEVSEFNPFDGLGEMVTSTSPLPIMAIDYMASTDIGSITTDRPDLSGADLALVPGEIADILTASIFTAMADNGHVFASDSVTCACCSHDHGVDFKAEMNAVIAAVDAVMAGFTDRVDFMSLIDAVADIGGVSSAQMLAAFSSTVSTLGQKSDNGVDSNEPANGDLPANTSTTGVVQVGGSVNGTRNTSTDEDWFAVELEAGVTYTMFMLRSGDNPHGDPWLNLYDSAGNLLVEQDDAQIFFNGQQAGRNTNSFFTFTATETGTHYLGALGWSTTTGDYTIYVEEGDNRPDFSLDQIAFFLTDQFSPQLRWESTDLTYDISALSQGAQTLALAAMDAWAEVSGLTFTAAAPGQSADITYNEDNAQDGGAQAFASTGQPTNGFIPNVTITVSENWTTDGNGNPVYDLNSYRYQTYLHEVGHALGLGHAGPYNGRNVDENGVSYHVYNQDAWNYTVMSYRDQNEADSGTPRLVLGLQAADIIAIQDFYGTNTTTRNTDSVYGFNSTEFGSVYDFENTFFNQGIRPPSLSIFDAGGTDTLDFSGYSADQFITLVEGEFLSVGDNPFTPASEAVQNNLTIAIGTVIENAIGGSGNDTFIGNAADNVFTGNGGDDTYAGGDGSDTVLFAGAQGDYTITTEQNGAILVITGANSGTDRIETANVEFIGFNNGAELVAMSEFVATGPVFEEFTEGDDVVTGDNDVQLYRTLGGNDVVDVLGGNDEVEAGAGNDMVRLGDGDDRGDGGGGNDTIEGGAGADDLDGGLGRDTLSYEGSSVGVTVDLSTNSASGGDATGDTIVNFENILGSAQSDFLTGDSGINVITGGDGNDLLSGAGGNDILVGGNGSDTLNGGLGADNMNGGGGFDTASYATAAAGVMINVGTGGFGGEANGDSYISIENFVGSAFDDVFIGDAADNRFTGNGGDDTYAGGDGTDTVLFAGAQGDYTITLEQNDTILVISGADIGTDRIEIANVEFIGFGNGAQTVATSSFVPTGPVFEEFTEGADILTGDNGVQAYRTLGGNDVVTALGGDDIIELGAGDDTVEGGAGADTLDGGTGTDWLSYENSGAGVSVDLGAGTFSGGDATGDVATGFENVLGSGFDDVLAGDATDNILVGAAGNDQLSGADGNDVLVGGLGNDSLDGGAGFDTASYLFSASGITIDVANGGTGGDAQGDTFTSIENFNGSNFDDTFIGDASDNRFVGNGGDDSYAGGAGTDTVAFAGAQGDYTITLEQNNTILVISGANIGTDRIEIANVEFVAFNFGAQTVATSSFLPVFDEFTEDADILVGDNGVQNYRTLGGNDVVSVLGGDDTVELGTGNDTVEGGAGADTLDGGSGRDLLSYENSSAGVNVNIGAGTFSGGDAAGDSATNFEDILGSAFNDTLTGDAGLNILTGGDGNDRLFGEDGNDILVGGEGADTLVGGAGSDSLNGGNGFDSADYRDATSRVAFDVASGGTVGDAAGDSFFSIERFYLSDFNDTVTGTNANEFFFGEDGNDVINGGGGIDRIYGGLGDDVQRGQDGNDQLYGSAGSDQLNGGSGFDIANYRSATAAITVNLGTGGSRGDADGDTYFGIEAVYGSDFNDILTGNSSSNDLRGFDGDDFLVGGAGNDRLYGGEGADTFNGGTGLDIAIFSDATSGVTLNLASGGTGGEAAGDSFVGIEWVFGSDFDDDITGDGAANRLTGGDGDDMLDGAGGNDRLLGGDGGDTINGGDGTDSIFGEAGDDILSGGAGNDFFFGGAGADSHDGGTGTDTVSYVGASSAVALNMQTGGTLGDAAGDSFTNIERVFGSRYDDTITGSDGNNTLLGNGGNDILAGGLGNDTLVGGAGIDRFIFDTDQDGADVISGFSANNEVIELLYSDPAFDSFAEVMAVASNAGANTIFDFGNGNRLTVVGQNVSDFSASNFAFTATTPAEILTDDDAFTFVAIDKSTEEAVVSELPGSTVAETETDDIATSLHLDFASRAEFAAHEALPSHSNPMEALAWAGMIDPALADWYAELIG